MAKSVVVTGASRGIGAATALLAARRGFEVCVNYNSHAEEAEAIVARISAEDGRAIAVQADAGREDELVAMFARCDRELAPLGGLVNNAGFLGGESDIEDFDAGAMRRLWDVNVVAYFVCAREAVRRMSTRRGGSGGAIVNVSSMSADNGGIGPRVHYATTNGARRTFTFGLAKQSGPKGIRVNGVMPGVIDTHFNDGFDNEGRNARLGAQIPIGRVGTGQDVAETIVWLLSDEAAFVSGAVIPVNGAFF
ncbi:SDR family oxidoreductase [Falsiroseomonas sp. HW251]|uniref:SDR family oxidoreductase n=1 Tax=Falsiroseomonas sp. HW251 TaxID=3390998 RepID=UPI003D3218F7